MPSPLTLNPNTPTGLERKPPVKNDQIETKETQVFVDTEMVEESPVPFSSYPLDPIGLVRMEVIVEQSEFGPTAFCHVQVSPKLPAGHYVIIAQVTPDHRRS